MHGAILPLPQYAFMAWCLVKHRDNFYLFLPFTLHDPFKLKSASLEKLRYEGKLNPSPPPPPKLDVIQLILICRK
jgi:hypothetical protein